MVAEGWLQSGLEHGRRCRAVTPASRGMLLTFLLASTVPVAVVNLLFSIPRHAVDSLYLECLARFWHPPLLRRDFRCSPAIKACCLSNSGSYSKILYRLPPRPGPCDASI